MLKITAYNQSSNIKRFLLLFAISLIIGLLWYSQHIVEKLREDNRHIVKIYAEIIAKTAADQYDTNLNFVFEEIIRNINFPIIYSDAEQNPAFYRNLPDSLLDNDELIAYRAMMDKTNEPIPIVYFDSLSESNVVIGYIHYGDSSLIRQLQVLPFLELGAVALFILIGFIGFTVIRNNEKRHIWVGMARETAHQLSTPVSALMGWIEWLKAHPDNCADIIDDMEIDLDRLQKVNNRFSKMGSESEFKEINLSEQVELVAEYLRRRLPSLGKNIRIINAIPLDSKYFGNGILLSWAIENVIKNAADAIDRDDGEIKITQTEDVNGLYLLITDNGKGIPRRDWKNIFRPGFSTKDRGWGLGLSLTRRIITEIHKGKIRVVQSEIGSGTTMEIFLARD